MNSWPGTDGSVRAAMMHDPDGPGPLPARLIVGGSFSTVGSTARSCIAAWDPAAGSWSSLGLGVAGYALVGGVKALAALPNGDLVAGGGLTTAGGLPVNCVARWDGTTWSTLGAGIGSPLNLEGVDALTTTASGDLIAGGSFATAGGAPASNVARWNGSVWSALGSGVDNRVFALITMPNGDVVAAGAFSTADGAPASRIARWNGTAWSPLGAGLPNTAYALSLLPNGNLLAATFVPGPGSSSPGSTVVRQWNGTAWSQLGGTISGAPGALVTTTTGSVIAAGGTAPYAGYCVLASGTTWTPLDTAPDAAVSALAVLPGGDVAACGSFTSLGGIAATSVARWNGTAWSPLSAGAVVFASALTTLHNGDVVAAGGAAVDNVSRWNGASWSVIGTVNGPPYPAQVFALTTLPNGDLIVGGRFPFVNGVSAANIARWDGTAWFPLGSGTNNIVFAVAPLPNGDLVAGGWFTTAGGVTANGIARWDGTAWTPFGSGLSLGGSPGPYCTPYAFATLPNGDLVAGGYFTTAGGGSASYIARWDGTAWFPLGSGMNTTVNALAVLPNGDLVAGGGFTTAGLVAASRIARWNGTTWSAMGTGLGDGVAALAVLPNGDVIVGGSFTTAGGGAASRVARWDGAAWAPLGAGASNDVLSITALPSGDHVVGGTFATIDNFVSPSVARLTTTCPAGASAAGAGCSGVGGPNVLAAASLPWIGATQRSLATGMPVQSIAVVVFGLSTASIPLASLLPQGGAGCSLLASPDMLWLQLTGNGSATISLVIPSTLALVGGVIHEQIVPLELDAAGAITAITSTNALVLTIGAF